jgi:hypothetical protein
VRSKSSTDPRYPTLTERHSRTITINLPIEIRIFPAGKYSKSATPEDVERGWEITDEVSERDIDNAIGYMMNDVEDGRAALPVELIVREIGTLVKSAIYRTLYRRAREKYGYDNTVRVDSTGKNVTWKRYAEQVAQAKLDKLNHYAQVASYEEYAKKNGVDRDGNVFDGPW